MNVLDLLKLCKEKVMSIFFKETEDVLQEKVLSQKEKDKLPSHVFGLPAVKKYPLIDAAHVKSAIAYFKFAKGDKNKKELAVNILKAAKKFDVKYSDDDIFMKYVSDKMKKKYS